MSSSSSVFAFHRDLSTPTSVDHSATAHFTAPDDINLITVQQHVLNVYLLTYPSTAPSVPSSSPTAPPPHLHLICHLPLFGSVASLTVLRLPSHTRDSLLLSFLDCKTSLLHFSPSSLSIYPLDTSYHEGLKEQVTHASHQSLTSTLPLLRVDPLHRCAVLLAYHHSFLVFPLTEPPTTLHPESLDTPTPPLYPGPCGILRPYAIPFHHPSFAPPRDPTAGLTDLIDFTFLSGYNSPTLLILHRHPYTWEGRYAAHRHTSQLLTLTLDLPSSSFLILARTALSLPYDTHALIPLPSPHGGAVVVSNHLMFHFSNQHIDYTLATSLYGDWDTKYHSEQSGVVVNLQLQAHAVLYSSPSLIHLLLGLRDGQLLLLTVETAGTGVRAMQMRKLAISAPPSTITTLHRRGTSILVYIGSRVGTSLLLDLRERSEDEMHAEVREQERQEHERTLEREERDRERQRMLHGDEETSHPLPQQAKTEAEEEFDDIFGMSLSTDREREAQRREERARAKEETSRQFELTVRDAMVGLAPTVDFVINGEKGRPLELVGICGQGQQGAITVQTVSHHHPHPTRILQRYKVLHVCVCSLVCGLLM